MKSELSIEIARPIADVFDYTNQHVAEWSLTVVEEQEKGSARSYSCFSAGS